MTKTELINKVAKEAGITNGQANAAVNAFIEVAKNALKDGDNVQIKGFGTFAVTTRKARTGRNPQTGAAIEIAERKSPTFKASSALKEIIK